MTPNALIELIEQAPSASIARARLRPHAKSAGLSRAYFNRIVTLMASSPEAGRSLADRWRLLADLGDEPALAYRAKGAAERLRGRWKESAESFRIAGEAASDPVERLSFQVGAIDSLARTGDVEGAVRLGRRLVRGLLKLGEEGLAGRCRLNLAAAYLWADRYAEAAKQLTAAREELDRAGLESEAAGARMSLSTCSFHMGNPEDSLRLAQEAASRYRDLGQEHMVRLCESNVAQAFLQVGRADEALEILLRLREGYVDSALDAARVEEFLGDAYHRLNMPQEARNAYEAAAALPAMRALPLNRANCDLGGSWSARAIGLPKIARRAAVRAAQAYESFGNPVWAAVARIAEAQALLDGDYPERAAKTAEPALAELKDRNAEFTLAEAYLLLAEIQIQLKQDPIDALRRADRTIRRRGMAGLEWRLHDLLARNAPSNRRLPHFRRMAASIARQRAAVVSTYAKTHYLADKAEALGRYLDELLQRPTRRRVAEAIEVIRTTRAAALIDEALSALPSEVGGPAAAELSALREELSREDQPESPGSTARRAGLGRSNRASVARRWIELTHRILPQAPSTRGNLGVEDPAAPQILTLTATRSYLLHSDRSRTMLAPEDLSRRLRWLRFELFEPLSDRKASPKRVLESLAELRRGLEPIWDRRDASLRIAPEGEFWGVPWSALSNLGEKRQEPVLCLAPGFGQGAEQLALSLNPSVAVWGAPRADLPQVEREIEAVAGRFPQALILRSAAQVREFLHDGDVDLLHVAGHARLDPFKPMFSFLELEGGRIHAVEIARSRLRVKLVNLSACDTGSLSTLNRYEPEGLVRAFLARGARAAVASMWALDDQIAADFADFFYELLQSGQFVGIAISEARDRIKETCAHPYFWAPMTLFGGYTP